MTRMKLYLLLAALFVASPARACPAVILAPCTISVDGNYTLGATINGAGQPIAAIVVAPGVTSLNIDCRFNRIVNHAGFTSQGIGIYGKLIANIVIENCDILGNGMLFGIQIDNSTNVAFGNITVKNSAISATLRGVQIRANDVTISNNVFYNIGGQQIFPDGISEAIEIYGSNLLVEKNNVWRVWNYYFGETVGLACSYQCTGATFRDNDIRNDRQLPGSWAMWLGGGTFNVSGNSIDSWDNGYTGTSVSSGTMTANEAVNTSTPYVGISLPAWQK